MAGSPDRVPSTLAAPRLLPGHRIARSDVELSESWLKFDSQRACKDIRVSAGLLELSLGVEL